MKKIIIALDYEPSAEKVAKAGYEIAKKMNADVLLLHIVSEPAYYSNLEYSPVMGYTGFAATDIVEMEKDLKKEAHLFLDQSKKYLGDDDIQTFVAEGDFTEAIEDAIKVYGADLLVMGTHNRRGLDKLLAGNFAAKMISRISIPLLAIPTNDKE